jgi:hypothetical protein
MSGTDALLAQRRQGGPRLPAHSPALLATCGPILAPNNAATPEAAAAEVARQKEAGADFIKMASITPEVYRAVQARADRLGIPVAGHLPAGLDVHEAITAGVRAIEHLGPGVALPAATSRDEKAVREAVVPRQLKLPKVKLPGMDRLIGRLMSKIVINPALLAKPEELTNMRHAIDTFDEDKARALGAAFAAGTTWNCPTLIRVKAQQLCDQPAFADDPDLRYMAPKTVAAWQKAAHDFGKFTTEQRETFAAQYALQLKLVKIFDDAGAPMLAGTDCVGAAWVVAGASLHREFDELTAAGLSPLRVLQMATLDPARFLGLDATGSGVVAIGSPADLLLLAADPLLATTNLRTIAGVVRAGAHTGATELAAIKDGVAARGLD